MANQDRSGYGKVQLGLRRLSGCSASLPRGSASDCSVCCGPPPAPSARSVCGARTRELLTLSPTPRPRVSAPCVTI